MRRFARSIALSLPLLIALGPAMSDANTITGTMKIVAFGTSLTARAAWPAALERALSRCVEENVSVETVALSGASSRWGLEAVDRVIAARPDILLVELYANDAALDRRIGLDESRENMQVILDRIRAVLPQTHIYLMAMNPMFGRRGIVRPELEDYLGAHRDVALRNGLGYFDFRPRWSIFSEDILTVAIPDGVHPRPAFATAVMLPPLVDEIAGRCGNEVPGSDLSSPAKMDRSIRLKGAP